MPQVLDPNIVAFFNAKGYAANQSLRRNSGNTAYEWFTPPSAANPTGTVGLTAVNGSAATFLRSDGAPALSQAIVPTWTGTHTFDKTAGTAISIPSQVTGSGPVNLNFAAVTGGAFTEPLFRVGLGSGTTMGVRSNGLAQFSSGAGFDPYGYMVIGAFPGISFASAAGISFLDGNSIAFGRGPINVNTGAFGTAQYGAFAQTGVLTLNFSPTAPWGSGTTLNQRFGASAGRDAATGDSNVCFGSGGVLSSVTSGSGNVAVGDRALLFTTTGAANTGIGYLALFSNTTGGSNFGLGSQALYGNVSGSDNIGIGNAPCYLGTAASRNIGVGTQSLFNATGSENIAIGYTAGNVITSGTKNICIGNTANTAANSSTYAIALGYGATAASNTFSLGPNTTTVDFTGKNIVTLWGSGTSNNERLGSGAGRDAATGDYNVTIGKGAGAVITSATTSVFMGYHAGLACTTGDGNTLIGRQAGLALTSGTNNTAVGNNALIGCQTGAYNMVVGTESLLSCDAVGNVAVGRAALQGVTSANLNVGIGYVAGQTVTTGANNVFIGGTSNAAATTTEYAIALGYGAIAATQSIALGASTTAATGQAVIGPTGANAVRVLASVGASAQYAKAGGAIFDHFTDGSSTSTDGTENDLYTDSIAASSLSVNGDKITATYAGIFVGHATATRKLKLYFAGTAIFDSTALVTASNANWVLTATIIRVSASVVRYEVSIDAPGMASVVPPSVNELTGLTLTNAAVLKVTGAAAAAGAASADIVAKLGGISWLSEAA